MNYIQKLFGHSKTIIIHKYYVFQNCVKAGIVFQGIIHDLSKFSPTEFFESVKYYTGKRSPIEVCKEANGYSKAWLHHRGRNKHHHVYWVDELDDGGNPIVMPYKYAIEQLCDYLGAGKAYSNEMFSYESEYNWWISKLSAPIAMSPQIIKFNTRMLKIMCEENSNDVLKPERSMQIYLDSINEI